MNDLHVDALDHRRRHLCLEHGVGLSRNDTRFIAHETTVLAMGARRSNMSRHAWSGDERREVEDERQGRPSLALSLSLSLSLSLLGLNLKGKPSSIVGQDQGTGLGRISMKHTAMIFHPSRRRPPASLGRAIRL